MAVTIEDIKKLRAMTGAGLADVKNALNEAAGDFDKAKDLLRERGLAIAAKRSDRETSNGCVLVKKVEGFAAMVAVKCETDFVAAGKDFIALVEEILDAAIANKCQSLDEVKQLVEYVQTEQIPEYYWQYYYFNVTAPVAWPAASSFPPTCPALQGLPSLSQRDRKSVV